MDSKSSAKMKTSQGWALGAPFNPCPSLQGSELIEVAYEERLTFLSLPIISLIL